MRARQFKSYIAAVMDADSVTYEYVYSSTARSHRHAEDEAREAVRQWGATLVEFTPVVEHRREARGHRLLVVAGFTFAVSGVTIAAMMTIGLSLEGAL